MKRLLMVILLIACFMTACVGKQYSVDYGGSKLSFDGAKDQYRAGEKVSLCFSTIATDTDYSFYLDDEKLDFRFDSNKGFIIEFDMPDHDAHLI